MNIDLGNFIQANVKVLSGRDKGELARKQLKLDELDAQEIDKIEVKIPTKVWSMNSSFFLGCFGPSVRKLGESLFRNKYVFQCDEVILKNVEDGISRALKVADPLGRPIA